MPDAQTIGVYSTQAADYASRVTLTEDSRSLTAFMADLPDGARVLDLGCGPARAAASMAARGFVTDAIDAAPGMVDLASQHPGVNARLGTFDDVPTNPPYHGIWANFCLLHALRADMPRHLAHLHTALVPGGRFHIGLKLGQGERRDRIGRLYTYYTAHEITGLVTAAGFSVFRSEGGESAGFSGEVSPWIILSARRV